MFRLEFCSVHKCVRERESGEKCVRERESGEKCVREVERKREQVN